VQEPEVRPGPATSKVSGSCGRIPWGNEQLVAKHKGNKLTKMIPEETIKYTNPFLKKQNNTDMENAEV
jgi:hypothetical protein